MAETVTVNAEAVQVQTTSGARSGLITRDNIEDIALKGRDFAGMLKLLPGVIDTRNREAPGWENMNNLSINGRTSFNFSYDGVTNKDTGQNGANYAAPGLDSIAEIRVQTSNFQAEYGRSSGATITVVTRSGTRDFHGSAAFYKRDDRWNGNDYQRRILCNQGQAEQCKAPFYTFDNTAWTIGGPVLIPKTGFNRDRNKLFFFWSQDILKRTDPGNQNQRRMPTALERQGNFSQSFDNQGRLIFIRDPLLAGNCAATTGGPACFANNIIPANRIDPRAQALLNLFPLPNATDPTGANGFNYVFQTVQDWPRNDQVLRVDWNVAENTAAYGRLQFGYEKRSGGVSLLGSSGGWPQMATKYEIDTVSYVNTVLHTFSPTLFSEFTVGVNWAHQNTSPLDDAARDANNRRIVLPGMPQFFPEANALDILPQATFTGGLSRNDWVVRRRAAVPILRQQHAVQCFRKHHEDKGGAHDKDRPASSSTRRGRPRARRASTAPTASTATRRTRGIPMSVLRTRCSAPSPSTRIRRASVGARAVLSHRMVRTGQLACATESHAGCGHPFLLHDADAESGRSGCGVRARQLEQRASAGLYLPVTTPQGDVRSIRPPARPFLAVYIGRLVPNSGNFINGMQVYDGTPQGTSPFRVAPRFSFAWDVTGDGRTAVRGGAGVFYDRYNDDIILDLVELPPLLNTYRTNYTTINDLLASPLTATPTNVRRVEPFTPPIVYNWSFGVQRDIGFNVVADAAYVGNSGRNQQLTVDINGRPYGYAYRASSLDPTNVTGGQAQPLPDELSASVPGIRTHTAARILRVCGLSLAAAVGQSPAIGRRFVGRRGVHLPNLQ